MTSTPIGEHPLDCYCYLTLPRNPSRSRKLLRMNKAEDRKTAHLFAIMTCLSSWFLPNTNAAVVPPSQSPTLELWPSYFISANVFVPNPQPSPGPTPRPTVRFTPSPTRNPVDPPTPAPTFPPTQSPTRNPTFRPFTAFPTNRQFTAFPTNRPVFQTNPTRAPTAAPTFRVEADPTSRPAASPVQTTGTPTRRPTPVVPTTDPTAANLEPSTSMVPSRSPTYLCFGDDSVCIQPNPTLRTCNAYATDDQQQACSSCALCPAGSAFPVEFDCSNLFGKVTLGCIQFDCEGNCLTESTMCSDGFCTDSFGDSCRFYQQSTGIRCQSCGVCPSGSQTLIQYNCTNFEDLSMLGFCPARGCDGICVEEPTPAPQPALVTSPPTARPAPQPALVPGPPTVRPGNDRCEGAFPLRIVGGDMGFIFGQGGGRIPQMRSQESEATHINLIDRRVAFPVDLANDGRKHGASNDRNSLDTAAGSESSGHALQEKIVCCATCNGVSVP